MVRKNTDSVSRNKTPEKPFVQVRKVQVRSHIGNPVGACFAGKENQVIDLVTAGEFTWRDRN